MGGIGLALIWLIGSLLIYFSNMKKLDTASILCFIAAILLVAFAYMAVNYTGPTVYKDDAAMGRVIK